MSFLFLFSLLLLLSFTTSFLPTTSRDGTLANNCRKLITFLEFVVGVVVVVVVVDSSDLLSPLTSCCLLNSSAG